MPANAEQIQVAEEILRDEFDQVEFDREIERRIARPEVVAAAEEIGFCEIWPTAREALIFLKEHVLKGLWRKIMGWLIDRAIEAGDKYKAEKCPVPAGR